MTTSRTRAGRLVWTCAALAAAYAIPFSPPTAADPPPAPPARHVECLTGTFCLCVTDSLQAKIDEKAKAFRDALHTAHASNQLAIYMSVPLSGSFGAYFPLNREVANDVADALGKRFGAQSVWVLNPATQDADLPPEASQADYMYLWAHVLYDAEHAKDGVDLIYFVGPTDFWRHLRLTGSDDLGFLGQYFDHRVQTDPAFADAVRNNKVTRGAFLSYYGFRASVAFSAGAHDEWNLAALINQERRLLKSGIIQQLPVFFDGSAVAPPMYDAGVPAGNVGQCPKL